MSVGARAAATLAASAPAALTLFLFVAGASCLPAEAWKTIAEMAANRSFESRLRRDHERNVELLREWRRRVETTPAEAPPGSGPPAAGPPRDGLPRTR